MYRKAARGRDESGRNKGEKWVMPREKISWMGWQDSKLRFAWPDELSDHRRPAHSYRSWAPNTRHAHHSTASDTCQSPLWPPMGTVASVRLSEKHLNRALGNAAPCRRAATSQRNVQRAINRVDHPEQVNGCQSKREAPYNRARAQRKHPCNPPPNQALGALDPAAKLRNPTDPFTSQQLPHFRHPQSPAANREL